MIVQNKMGGLIEIVKNLLGRGRQRHSQPQTDIVSATGLEPLIFNKVTHYLPMAGELNEDPLIQYDSDLMVALGQAWRRIGRVHGISAVALENHFNWADYHSPEYPDFKDFKDVWVGMTVVKDGVPYFLDFDMYGLAGGMGMWSPTVTPPENVQDYGAQSLQITSFENFYYPKDLKALIRELSPEEIEQKNRDLAKRGIHSLVLGDILRYPARNKELEQLLLQEIGNAPELESVHHTYLNAGYVS